MKARLHIGIYAECPHCGMDCSLMDPPYDPADYLDSAIDIDSLKHGKEINWEIGCVHCGEDFNINKIEW